MKKVYESPMFLVSKYLPQEALAKCDWQIGFATSGCTSESYDTHSDPEIIPYCVVINSSAS